MSDDFLTRGLRDRVPVWPEDAGDAFVDVTARRAVDEGVHVLLLDALGASGAGDARTGRLQGALRERARREAMVDLAREEDLKRTLGRLAAEGVRPLLLKGGALALTHYAASHHRPRCDTDLLVDPQDALRAEDVLEASGYVRHPGVRGRLIAYESTWVRRGPLEPLQIDLHWRASNVQGFARAFSFEELDETARSVEALSPHARAPDDVHALFVTAMHLVGNDRWGNGRKLIWLYDLLVLGRALDDDSWERVVDLASGKGLRTVARTALERTRAALGLQIPDRVSSALDVEEARREVTAGYVDANHARALLTDLRAIPRPLDRVRLLLEHAFPQADYLRWRFGADRRVPVLRLHARRILEGRRRTGTT